MMPEGTIPRGPAFFRKPVGRWGAARLAQLTDAPVIPVGLWGTERVWPRSSRVPNVFNLTSPPTVRVRVGEPVEFKGRSLEADTKRMMAAIVALLPADAYRRRTPERRGIGADLSAGIPRRSGQGSGASSRYGH